MKVWHFIYFGDSCTEAYRARFLEAMDQYFHMVPDQWTFTSTFMMLRDRAAGGNGSGASGVDAHTTAGAYDAAVAAAAAVAVAQSAGS